MIWATQFCEPVARVGYMDLILVHTLQCHVIFIMSRFNYNLCFANILPENSSVINNQNYWNPIVVVKQVPMVLKLLQGSENRAFLIRGNTVDKYSVDCNSKIDIFHPIATVACIVLYKNNYLFQISCCQQNSPTGNLMSSAVMSTHNPS